MDRTYYNAIKTIPEFVTQLLCDAEKTGAWSTGIESDKKLRGSAINASVYGYDAVRGLAVVQVRECVFHPRRFNRVRKDYYLIGHTESGEFFAHPISSPARSRKIEIETPEETVRRVLCQIWDVSDEYLDDIERQGDIAFVPVVHLPRGVEKVDADQVVIRDTHVLTADEIYVMAGTYYVKRGARLVHTKREHRTIKAKAGLYRVQPGVRASNWGFTAPHGD